ncbi:pilus assembly protein TadG-related protein [Pseudoduganella sp. UC29_106]|uniref:pilus assembly protein TadG-related protein n=1 Tax=Pseudoduganella sp. UC29_106 TaxID=3374553 RepID=UPI0037579272
MKPPRHRQHGVVAIIYALMLVVLLGFAGLAVDLGLMYQRKAQLQNAADSIALAAALRLNGTAAGVAAAGAQAQDIAISLHTGGSTRLTWNDSALRFSSDPDAPANAWLSAAAAATTPAAMRYARVDTRQLGGAPGVMQPFFMGVLGVALPAIDIAGVAVAGPHALNVLPFAICAMGPATQTRANSVLVQELVEYGFRYGVGYNLLRLNPASAAAAGEYFLLDPLAPPGTPSPPANTDDSQIGPFMCTGKVAYVNLLGGAANLRRPGAFTLWPQLNSRFSSTPACNADAAPPDANIRAYTAAQAPWMNNAAALQTAQSTPAGAGGQPLRTIADPAPLLPPVAPGLYGVLWTYGPALRATPPNLGFATANWQTLYPSAPAISGIGWPGAGLPPYRNPAYSTPPPQAGRSFRRLLYVPLLSCPVPAGQYVTAPVLAVARFLMTAPATATELSAEFAGVLGVPANGEPPLAADVELIR